MAWTIPFYHGLIQLAATSFLLLIMATAAILAIRQPARRIRVIECTLAGMFVVPLLALVPGYPRWSILPQLDAPVVPPMTLMQPMGPTEHIEAWPRVAIEPNAEPVTEPVDNVLIAFDEPRTFVQAEIKGTFQERAIVPPSHKPKWELALPQDYRFWIVMAFLSGVAAMASWSLLGLVAVKRLLRSVRPANAACRDMLREIAGPRSDQVALVVSARVSQPCAFAWLPATIVLPQELCIAGDRQKLRWALAHEWSHVESGDVWSWSLSGIMRWCYFYQPLLWWLRRQLQLNQDFVADSRAAQSGELAEDYAEYLTFSSAHFTRPVLAAGLGIGGRNSDLKRRVIMLVENRYPLEVASPRKWNLAAFPLAILFVAAVACLGEQRADADGEPAQLAVPSPKTEAAKPALADDPLSAQPVVGPQAEVSKPANPEAPIAAKPPALQVAPVIAQPPGRPRRIAPGDVLIVDVIPNIESSQDGQARVLLRPEMKLDVDENGNISFGSLYGFVSVHESTLGQAQEQIQKYLLVSQNLSHINVRVTFARESAVATPVVTLSPKGQVQAMPAASAVPDPAKVESLEKMRRKGYVTPRRVKPGDCFNIEVEGTPDDHPVQPVVSVDGEGRVALGAHYGKVNIQGKTLDEAEAAIREFLMKTLQDPKVQLTYRDAATPAANIYRVPSVASNAPTVSPHLNPASTTPASIPFLSQQVIGKSLPGPNYSWLASSTPPRIKPGDILDIEIAGGLLDVSPRMVAVVESSGKVALGVHYGRVVVQGKTLEEAEEAIKKSLSETIKEPQVQVTYWRANEAERPKSEEASKVKQLEREINELKARINDLKSGKSS